MRKRRPKVRTIAPDPRYGDTLVTRFVNNIMWQGKKSTAYQVFYDAMDIIKERTKEIGIRKAIGAKPLSIVGMILQEAVFVTMFAGLFGLIAGLGLLELVGPQIESDFIKYPQVNFNIALITVFLLVFAGALAGFFPAYRAAKIKPIVALRDE